MAEQAADEVAGSGTYQVAQERAVAYTVLQQSERAECRRYIVSASRARGVRFVYGCVSECMFSKSCRVCVVWIDL